MKKFLVFTLLFPLFLLSCSSADSPLVSQPAGGRGGGAPIGGTTSYSLAVALLGSGNVTGNPAGIDCGISCSAPFSDGTSVALTATPQSGSTFAGWSGDCGGTASCTLVMNANHKVTAAFVSGKALNITLIDGGRAHTCGIIFRSAVVCWGNNVSGQLGVGTFIPSFKPEIVNLQSSADLVTAGDDHTCILVSQGTIQCWGLNNNGQLGNGTTINSNQPVTVTGLNDPVGLSAGGAHTCGLNSDGSVFCWGLNRFGQLGNNDSTNANKSSPVSVYGLTSSSSSTVTSISAGANHTCALIADGSVFCWGSNQLGQLGNGSSSISSSNKPVPVFGMTSSASQTATAISSGGNHTCALISDGTVKCWGSNSSGQLGNGSPSGSFSNKPVPVTGLTTATAVSSGGNHTCALMSDGTVLCWGSNLYGELGNVTVPFSQTTPVPVSGLSTAVSIGTGLNHTCAILSDQTVDCWGDNSSGQLGTGNTLSYSTPQPVSGL